ncbi:hypothetical protein EYF80_022203 [Liparis tanakae]|uniref:Uncharacterized protein n=1 Tax=Liparis tanakae TaxID=230148 RepID=A0A4Z2HPL1_9TELE|nr:hypothetical protein EYF80_022203 [Liparis tanakae]
MAERASGRFSLASANSLDTMLPKSTSSLQPPHFQPSPGGPLWRVSQPQMVAEPSAQARVTANATPAEAIAPHRFTSTSRRLLTASPLRRTVPLLLLLLLSETTSGVQPRTKTQSAGIAKGGILMICSLCCLVRQGVQSNHGGSENNSHLAGPRGKTFFSLSPENRLHTVHPTPETAEWRRRTVSLQT